MKHFQQYIFELNKKYEFRIKLATVEPKGEIMERIKNAINTYELDSVSAVKSLPIMEHREFPRWGPCECWQFDVTVNYPVIAAQLRQVIKERAGINPDWICVRNLNEAEDTEEAESYGHDHKGALLDDAELKAQPGGQELVGQSRIGSLLKELESRQYEVAGNDRTDGKNTVTTGKTTNDAPMGKTSTVGSRKNKIPDPTKG